MIPGLYLQIAKIGLLGTFLLALGFGCYREGKKAVQADWDASKDQLAQAQSELVLAHEAELSEVRKQQNETNVKVSQNYERKLDELGKNYAADVARIRSTGGLRLPGSICAGGTTAATEAKGNGGHNEESPGTVALPQQTQERLFNLALEADQVTEQLRACQAWITKQGFY